jgi:hypothetical protein
VTDRTIPDASESVGGAPVRTWRGRGRPPAPGYEPPLSNEAQGGEPPTPRARAWQIHEARERAEWQRQLGLLEQVTQSLGGIFSALTAPPIDDVLFAGSVAIEPPGGSNAYKQLDFRQETAFVAIFNYQTIPVWVLEGGYTGGDGPPGLGAGRFQIQGGEARGVPIRGESLTLWIATAPASGPTCDLAVYARGGAPFSAAIS